MNLWIPSASHMNYLNASLLLILCASAIHGVDKDDIRPLQTVSGDQEALQSLWRELSHGKSKALLNIEGSLFLSPLGTSHHTHGIIEHWTRSLPRLLQQHKEISKALAALDQHFQREISLRHRSSWPQVAIRYLPAPKAQHILEDEADRFFDRGQFLSFLAISDLLTEAGALPSNPHHHKRFAIAEAAVYGDRESPWAHSLPAPGPLQALSRPEVRQMEFPNPDRHRHHWALAQNLIIAQDPYGQVLWQRPLHPRSQTWFGPHHALILSPYGLELLQRDGRSQTLKMPTSVRPLGIIGGSGWFQNDSTIYRLNLNDSTDFLQIELPNRPLSAPLVSGDSSLWLLPNEIILLSEGHITNRYLHDIDTRDYAENWSLHLHNDRDIIAQIVVQNGEQAWSLNEFPEDATGPMRAQHLNRAGRHVEALSAWESLTETDRKLYNKELAVALCAMGPASRWSVEEALRWVNDPTWSLRVAIALGGYPDQGLAFGKSVIDLALNAPSALIPLDPRNIPLHPSHAWKWMMSGAGLDYAHKHSPPKRFSWISTQEPVVMDPPITRKLQRSPQQGSRDRRFLSGHPLTLGFEEDSTEIRLFSQDRTHLLWQQRWATPAYLPGRSVALRQGVLIVTEGQSRIHVINPNNGAIMLKRSVPNGLAMPSQTHWLGGDSIGILSPIGVNNRLTIVDHNQAREFKLPQPAKWSIALNGHILIADFSGNIRRYPDNIAINWQGDIPAETPIINEDGLFADGLHWQWRKK